MNSFFTRCCFVLLFSGFAVSLHAAEQAEQSASPVSFSGRIRSVSMVRDYEDRGTGSNSTLGVLFHARGELTEGLAVGATYIYAEEVYEKNQSELLSNDGFNLLNEAWLRGQGESLGFTAGRYISNGEIFRKDDSRQKPRAIEGAQVSVKGVTLAHAYRMSNYLQSGDKWEFHLFEDVFKVEEADSEGVTWFEGDFAARDALAGTVYAAVAWDITHLTGLRLQWQLLEEGALLLFARAENGIGANPEHQSETYGLSWQQQLRGVTLEPGLLSVHGDKMLFQETTTGFNHALAKSMIIYACPFDGGADTLYLKASSRIAETNLYFLGMYTRHDQLPFDAVELNAVVRQALSESVELTFKGGVGYRDTDENEQLTATDLRIFLTWDF